MVNSLSRQYVPVNLMPPLMLFVYFIKVTPKLSEAMAIQGHCKHSSKWEANQRNFFFPSARGDGGAGGNQAEYFNNSFFSISCPSSSNRIEFLKNLYREHFTLLIFSQ